MRDRKFEPRSRPPWAKTGAKKGPHRGGSRDDRRPPHRAFGRGPRDRDGPALLYGWHTVKEALANPKRRFHRLLATENALHRLTEEGIAPKLKPTLVRPEDIAAELGPDAVHQGLLAEADPLPSPAIDKMTPSGILLVLDQITDPHNVGAILRSAAAFAATGVVITARHSPEATGVLAKAASGALEHVPIITVPNLARALDTLKQKNALVVGLDSSGESDLAALSLRAPLVLVLGAEGKGLRQLTRTTCDHVARLDMPGAIKSLNVSNATALALYIGSTSIRTSGA